MITQSKNKRKDLIHLSDSDIITRIVDGGETELFNELYDRYANKVYYKCLSFSKEVNTAKDLAHDIFVKVFMNIHKYKGKGELSMWIYSITYNYCVDYLRKKKRIHFEEFEANDYNDLAQDSDAEAKELKEIKINELEVALERVAIEDKMILLMYYKDDLSVRQIAASLGITESAVKMRLKRARDRVAKQYHKMKSKR